METQATALRPSRRVYRNDPARLVIGFINLMAVGWVIAALFPGPQQGLCIGAAVLFVVWAVWIWQYGVHVTSRGVTLATQLRATRIPWSEIERFELVPLSAKSYVFAVVKKGEKRMVVSTALATPERPEAVVEHRKREIQAVIDELNDLLAAQAAAQQAAG